jgi:hypothetical protein
VAGFARRAVLTRRTAVADWQSMELCCDPELVSRRLEAHKGPLNAVNRDGTISERYCRRRAAGVLCRAYIVAGATLVCGACAVCLLVARRPGVVECRRGRV